MQVTPCSILYLGSNSPASTSRHRADSLRRLGCAVWVLDSETLKGARSRFLSFLDYRSGYRLLQRCLLNALSLSTNGLDARVDLIWVDSGELYGPLVVKWLRKRFSCPILLYNIDDPTGARDSRRFQSLLSSIPYYDLCVFVRAETSLEALAIGARRVLTVHRSYDELHHSPTHSMTIHEPDPVVAFTGTMIPGEKRDDFLLELLNAGLPLRLFGSRWERSRHWPSLSRAHHGQSLSGKAYAQSLGSAAISLGLLSHKNRDLITTRTLEVPACGGLLCAERTSEHQLLYEQGRDAVFWSSIDECSESCRILLEDPNLSASIRAAGLQKVRRLGVGNEDICTQILAEV